VKTDTCDDPASTHGKILAVETRIAPDGSIETVVGNRCLDKAVMLELHQALVRDALTAWSHGLRTQFNPQ